MKRYKIICGIPACPPQNGISADGRAITNFAERIYRDAAFAAANGYYPMAESDELEQPSISNPTYRLVGGAWVRQNGG